MRALKVMFLTAAALAFASGSALAFHEGGVAYCQGCHTMHNSQNGQAVDAAHPSGNAYLLNAGNPSDTCLKCHAAYGQFASGTGFGPGGDFYWVTKTFSWSSHGSTVSSAGDSHGHNIISPANGLAQDATLSAAPGGTFQSQYLNCSSCHDPHGNTNFRLLYGAGTGPVYDGTRFSFANAAPLAKGNGRKTVPGSDNRESNTVHTIYKSGMSQWCANCHSGFHSLNTTNFVHPTGEALGSTIAAAYNAYVSTDDMIGGNALTSYAGLVPFEAVNVDLTTADPQNYTAGPTSVDKVMCLTCHRAHASPFKDSARWDLTATWLADSHPQATDIGATANDVAYKYYNYTFVQNQRSLCNKCHLKDAGDEPYPTL